MNDILAVYDKEKAPEEKDERNAWLRQQEKEEKEYGIGEIEEAAPDLQAWFMEMIRNFPPRKGRFSPKEEDLREDPALKLHLTDYYIGKNTIRASFQMESAKQAWDVAEKLAMVYDVGFCSMK